MAPEADEISVGPFQAVLVSVEVKARPEAVQALERTRASRGASRSAGEAMTRRAAPLGITRTRALLAPQAERLERWSIKRRWRGRGSSGISVSMTRHTQFAYRRQPQMRILTIYFSALSLLHTDGMILVHSHRQHVARNILILSGSLMFAMALPAVRPCGIHTSTADTTRIQAQQACRTYIFLAVATTPWWFWIGYRTFCTPFLFAVLAIDKSTSRNSTGVASRIFVLSLPPTIAIIPMRRAFSYP